MAATVTVDDVWRVRGDWRAMREAALRLRDERRATADALRRSAAALRHGQELLAVILDRVDVPMTLDDDGRLTFYPADADDLASLRRAELAAREIQAALHTIVASHRAAAG
ncbi:hypothetical protein ACFO1B_36040 [Dactylosporangium siamense]|uniref:Uncharacterized protein n=1 Tax=Dactylosporangium siamense TaxID=685454 RepID=A0A919U8Q7_9ACTN|nr:hypothetical protein [Dactylosporangium siamense]GIG45987.1 hypothetical protein Dsi01nite_040280 [Dactylosporangium siamense]